MFAIGQLNLPNITKLREPNNIKNQTMRCKYTIYLWISKNR